MKTTILTGTFLGMALLIAGCGRAPQPAPPAVEPEVANELPVVPQEEPPPLPDGAGSATMDEPVGDPLGGDSSVGDDEMAEGTQVARGGKASEPVEKAAAEESGENPSADKPTVLKAVGRALLRSFTSESEQEQRPEAPAFRSQR